MTALDNAISAAYKSQGKQEDINKVYLLLLRSVLFVPTQKDPSNHDEEPFKPLFAKIDDQYFMTVFDTLERLTAWAGDNINNIGYVELSGHDVIAGLNESVFLCLNYGSEFYKEFSPDEVKHLKKIVAKIEQLKN